MSLNHLALVLRDQGKGEQAEEILREALRLKEAMLGKEHPFILASVDSLATVHWSQGQVRAGGRDASTSTQAEGDGAGSRAS
jgi:hypothetical protein